MKGKFLIRMVLLTSIIIAALCPRDIHAQITEDEFHYGFYAGATYAKLDNISSMIIRPVFSTETYNTAVNYQFGPTVGFFIYNRFKKSALAIQPEIAYAKYGGEFQYDDVDDLKYTIAFNYNYFNIATLAKIHPTGGLFLGLGPQVGFNLSKTNIQYKSNQPILGPDLQVEQSLQEVLKGNTDFSVIAAIGFESQRGFVVEARFKQGLSDAISTLSNGFYFIENQNNSRAFQLTIGYAIPFY